MTVLEYMLYLALVSSWVRGQVFNQCVTRRLLYPLKEFPAVSSGTVRYSKITHMKIDRHDDFSLEVSSVDRSKAVHCRTQLAARCLPQSHAK